jgi:uncharacterized membrane protein
VHRRLIVLPLSLWTLALGFDVVSVVSRSDLWAAMAYWNLGAGLATALLAGLFGVLDHLGIAPGTRAARVGLAHALLNIMALGLLGVSFAIRTVSRDAAMAPWALSTAAAGYGLVLGAGWLGRELARSGAIASAELGEG